MTFNTSDSKGNISAYPLTWPEGWQRTNPARRGWSQFGAHSMKDCARKIIDEVRLAAGQQTVISTNVTLRLDGLPYSNQKPPADPGAAVYFRYEDKPIVLACDRWRTVEENLWAIAKHIEALRGQERWGVGSLEQAFQGYIALPAPEQWWQVLGVPSNADADTIQTAYRTLARKHHPDAGGNHDQFVRIQAAYDAARKVTT